MFLKRKNVITKTSIKIWLIGSPITTKRKRKGKNSMEVASKGK